MRAGAIDEAPVLREMAVFLRHVTAGQGQFEDTDWAALFGSHVNPFVAADHLGEMIESAARRRPLLILVDDAQEADEVSAVALQALVRSHAAAPVLWVLARTPVPAQSLAQHALGWLCGRVAVQLHLGLLDDEAAAALRMSKETPPFVTPRIDRSGGGQPPRPLPSQRQCGCDDVAARVLAALGQPFEAPARLARALSLLAGAGRGAEAARLADAAVRTGMEPVAEAQLTMTFVPGLQGAARHDIAITQLRRTLGRRDLFEADRTNLEGLLTGAVRRAATARAADVPIPGPGDDTTGVAQVAPAPSESGCAACGSPSWAWIVHALIAADRFEDAETVAAAIRTAGHGGDIYPEGSGTVTVPRSSWPSDGWVRRASRRRPDCASATGPPRPRRW